MQAYSNPAAQQSGNAQHCAEESCSHAECQQQHRPHISPQVSIDCALIGPHEPRRDLVRVTAQYDCPAMHEPNSRLPVNRLPVNMEGFPIIY